MASDKLNTGVLMLGSLLWDNDFERKSWRDHYFGRDFYSNIIDVKVPIRYGRYSKGRKCPTMVLSSAFLEAKKFGTAKFVPFKNKKMTVPELICAAKDLSKAEGSSDRKFIKGKDKKNEWCILVYWMNSKIGERTKTEFSKEWEKVYEEEEQILSEDYLNKFRMDSEIEEENFINENGSIKFKWPESLNKFDIILATQTKPRKNSYDQSEYLKPDELASHIFKKPEYFIKNRLNGIITSEDDSIIEILKSYELAIFRSNALKDGCSESETDTFIQLFLK